MASTAASARSNWFVLSYRWNDCWADALNETTIATTRIPTIRPNIVVTHFAVHSRSRPRYFLTDFFFILTPAPPTFSAINSTPAFFEGLGNGGNHIVSHLDGPAGFWPF
jgi:hypothetical protein